MCLGIHSNLLLDLFCRNVLSCLLAFQLVHFLLQLLNLLLDRFILFDLGFDLSREPLNLCLPEFEQLAIPFGLAHRHGLLLRASGFAVSLGAPRLPLRLLELVLQTLDVQLQLLLDLDVVAHLRLVFLQHQLVVLGRLSQRHEALTATHGVDAGVGLVQNRLG